MDKKIIVVDRSTSGDYFLELRERIGMTQDQAAAAAGVSQQLISLLEREGIRSGTRWNKMGKLLKMYAARGAPSMFAVVCKDGVLIDSISELYSAQDMENEKRLLQLKLREFLGSL